MLTVAVLALLFGICLLIASGTSLLLRLAHSRDRRGVGNTPVTPVAAWRPGTHVAGVGTIGYGPMGSIVCTGQR